MFLILTVFWTLYFFTSFYSTKGIGQWDCQEGYHHIGNNLSACNDLVPFLLFSHGNDILSIDSDGTNLRTIVPSAGSSVLLDFDPKEQRLYWLDPNRYFFQRIFLNGTKRERMRAVVKGATRFTLDWKNKRIFWSKQHKGTIQWTDMSGKKSQTLLRGLVHPTFISVDPMEGFLFWTSGSSVSVIQRSNLNGTNVMIVLEIKGVLKGLILDTTDKNIYWVMSKQEDAESSIGTCTYHGGSAKVIKYLGHSSRHSIWGLSLFSDHIYYSERKSASIQRINKYTGKESVKITLKPTYMDITAIQLINISASSQFYRSGSEVCTVANDSCTGICQTDPVNQQCRCMDGFQLAADGNHCEDINECAMWTHGCTLGCENIPGSYYCTCPRGYVLLPDSKSCHDATPCLQENRNCSHGCVQTAGGPVCFCPEGSVLASDGKTCRGCSTPDNGGCSQLCRKSRGENWECDCVPGYTLQWDKKRCLASGPRPFFLFANVHDIRRMNFDGTHYERLLESQMGRVFALDYDPVDNRIYFAHTALKCIESAKMDGSGREKVISEALDTPEGVAIDAINRKLYWTDRGKSCIERSNLNGENRKTIIQENVHQPRGICVHPLVGRLFWTDVGSSAQIGSSHLDGSKRIVVVSTNLVWPSGITVETVTDKLYWCDAKRSVVESSDLDGSNRHTISQNEVGYPFGIAVFEDHIWLSDWLQPSIIRMDKRNTRSWVRLRGSMQRPSALVVVHPLAKLAITDIRPEPRKELAVGNGTTGYQPFLYGPLTGNFYGTGIRADANGSNELDAEILVSDESGCMYRQCDINAQCVPSEDGPRCQCLEGYTGNGESCNDIDECSVQFSACHPHLAECINMDGGYVCKCRDGFLGNGLECADIDECTLGIDGCGEQFQCANTPGNYTCICTNGLPGTADNCIEFNMNVKNSSGNRHTRECPASYEDYCFNGGVCMYFPVLEDFGCTCVRGYIGERCQFDDLEWWAPHATETRIRNVTIGVSLVVLLVVLGLVSFVIYYYRHQRVRSRDTDVCHVQPR
ncbi:pro-epidermal growth factor isoform X3 [Pseudophryne corroboree]|uniref:pro-epidermal growth factor isoform X3 n=1 Tax=Pseudophryne corroboree TaxID=495146 RepID=UPI0030818F60